MSRNIDSKASTFLSRELSGFKSSSILNEVGLNENSDSLCDNETKPNPNKGCLCIDCKDSSYNGYRLLFIPEFNLWDVEIQLDRVLGSGCIGKAIILDKYSTVYYVSNGVLEYKEKLGIGQTNNIPLRAKICNIDLTRFKSDDSSLLGFHIGSRNILRTIPIDSKATKNIIDEAHEIYRILPKNLVLIELIDKRLERVKNTFRSKMRAAIKKKEKLSSKQEKHPFCDLPKHELKIILELLYKEKIEEILLSHRNLGIVKREKYKLDYSPLSNASLWFYADLENKDEKNYDLRAIYKAIEKRINNQFKDLFSELSQKKSLNPSKVFLRYLELYYKSEIRQYIQENDLASAVVVCNNLKKLKFLFNKKFLIELYAMISEAVNKSKPCAERLDNQALSKIRLIQEKIDFFIKPALIWGIVDQKISKWNQKFNEIKPKKEKSLQEAISPQSDEIILDLIRMILIYEKNELLGKSKTVLDGYAAEIYSLFTKAQEMSVDLEKVKSSNLFINNKEKCLNLIEKIINDLNDEKNRLINHFHRHMNFQIAKKLTNKTKPTIKKSVPVLKPNLLLPPPSSPPNSSFLAILIRICNRLLQWLAPKGKKNVQIRTIYGMHAIHYTIIPNKPRTIPKDTLKNTPKDSPKNISKNIPKDSLKDGQLEGVEDYKQECSVILSM